MAVIKDFFTEKSKRQQNNLDYKERIRAHKLSVFFKTVLSLVLIVVSIILINTFYNEKTFTAVSNIGSIPVSVVSGATAMNLNGNLLIYSKDGASCMDPKGKAIWNESYEMQKPLVDICGSTVAIGDYNGRTVYVANKNGTLGTVKTNLPIRGVAVSDNGVVATVLDDSEVIRIYVYDGNTDTETPIVEAKATMNKSGYPISISLSPNGRIMMVSYFYLDSGQMKSTVSFYNFGEVGSNEVDNFVSGYDYAGSLLPYVEFINNDASFGVADDRIVFFKGDEIPENKATSLLDERIMGIYHNENYVGLVYRDTSGDYAYKVDVYNSNGNKLSTIQFDIEYTDIIFYKDQIMIYGGSDCNIYTVKGTERFAGKFESDVNLVIPLNSINKMLLVTGEELTTVELN